MRSRKLYRLGFLCDGPTEYLHAIEAFRRELDQERKQKRAARPIVANGAAREQHTSQ